MTLDTRLTELVAVGASITANCQPCLQYHVGKAREHGVDEQEIAQAIQIGWMVRKGAASKMEKLVVRLTGDPASAAEAASTTGCGSS